MRRFCLALLPLLALFAVAAPAPATAQSLPDMTTLDEAQRNALHGEIRAYLLENPEIIMEAIQVLEQQRRDAERFAERGLVDGHREALFNNPHDWVGGNPEGPITLVEFSDYRCGFCKRAHPIIAELLERSPDVRLVVKEFPILGPDSVTAGRMAMAAHDLEPEKYKALNDALMTYRGNLTEAAAYRIANEVGYDIAALKAHAGSDEIDARLRQNYELASALGVQGTPSFVLENQILRGFLPLEDMLARVAQARQTSN
ncbi:MAG: DsbA family protein [Pseudomonadota bacterium]